MANEKRLIVDSLKKYHDSQFTPGVYEHSIFGKAAMLLEVDAVEVVRCKNCKCSEDGYICNGTGFMIPPHPTYPEWFCSC